MTDARDALIEQLRQANEQLGRLVAQQQSVIAAQQKLSTELEQRLAERDAEHAERASALQAEVRRLERELLGPKSEKLKIPPADRDLGAEAPDEEELARRREETARKRRENAITKQNALAKEEVDYKVPEDQKRCTKCNGTRFGALAPETSTTFEYVPGRFVRRVHRREKLACSCGQHIVVAPAPPKLVAGGRYGFGFAAFLVVEKCVDSIPIHRIERRFQRLGIPMSRASMNDVLHAAAERTRPLVARLQSRIAALDVVLADETSMRLQDRKKRGFVWVFQGHDSQTGGELVLYVFATDHSGETPAQILGGTRGTLVVDGYTGYNNVTDPEGRARASARVARRSAFERLTELREGGAGIRLGWVWHSPSCVPRGPSRFQEDSSVGERDGLRWDSIVAELAAAPDVGSREARYPGADVKHNRELQCLLATARAANERGRAVERFGNAPSRMLRHRQVPENARTVEVGAMLGVTPQAAPAHVRSVRTR